MLLVTLLQAPPGSPVNASDPTWIRTMARQAADRAQPQSTSARLEITDFAAGAVRGASFSATDTAPEPGGFKFMSQGLASLGSLVVNSTVLSNRDPSGYRQTMLSVLGSLRASPSQATSPDDDSCELLANLAREAMDARQHGTSEARLMQLNAQVCEGKAGDAFDACHGATRAMAAIIHAAYQEPRLASEADRLRATTAYRDKISRVCLSSPSGPP
ncbi:MAG TPA: hypothetical protein VFN09_15950 [Rhodanobacteraceae bacterium]|nr:hypothetical protein [Rhodanobacteraceae bacterium]